MPSATRIDAVVFDIGGVLVDWNPRHLYRRMFDGDEAAMETFLAEVCTPAWNNELDRGADWTEAIETLAAAHPDKRDLIFAYHERWPEMLAGAIDGTVELVAELRSRGVPIFALSNWAATTFAVTKSRFPFLDWFDGVVISGDVGATKPEPDAFRALIDRFGLRPASTVFIDDAPANVEAAREHGLVGIRFESPSQVRRSLEALGVLSPA